MSSRRRWRARAWWCWGSAWTPIPSCTSDFLSRSHISFLTARDPEAKISADYGTFKYPESYIIDSKGKVVQKIIGATNWTDGSMVNAVKSFL